MTANNPYQYEWTASNALEALNILDAVQGPIITIYLDEAPAVLAANEVNALNRVARMTGEPDA
jgi:hypothetical protein